MNKKYLWMPSVAGSLQITIVLILLLFLLFYLIFGVVFFLYYPIPIIISIVAGYFIFVGGVNSFRKQSWTKSLIGSSSILLVFSPYLLVNEIREATICRIIISVTVLIGMIAAILIFLSKDQFIRKNHTSSEE